MAKDYDADFLLCSSFPNFVQRTNQICTAGRGKAFLKTQFGKWLKYKWLQFSMEAQSKFFFSTSSVWIYPPNHMSDRSEDQEEVVDEQPSNSRHSSSRNKSPQSGCSREPENTRAGASGIVILSCCIMWYLLSNNNISFNRAWLGFLKQKNSWMMLNQVHTKGLGLKVYNLNAAEKLLSLVKYQVLYLTLYSSTIPCYSYVKCQALYLKFTCMCAWKGVRMILKRKNLFQSQQEDRNQV